MNEENNIPLIGDYLKHKRENRRISLAEVAQKTKVNIQLLSRLENNDIELLPSYTYVRGFVFNYLRAINTVDPDVEKILQNTYDSKKIPWNQKSSSRNDVKTTEESSEIILSWAQRIFNSKNIIIAILILITVGIYNLVILINKQVEEPTTKVTVEEVKEEVMETPVLTSTPTDGLIPATTLPAAPETTPTTEIKKEESVAPAVETKKEEVVDASIYPKVTFAPVRIQNVTIDANAAENKNEELLPAEYRASSDNAFNTLVLNASSGDTWLAYKIDNNRVKTAYLTKGKILQMQGKDLFLFIGNSPAVHMFFNNKLVQLAGTRIKNLVFPLENSSKHQMPLFVQDKKSILHFYPDYQKLSEEEALKAAEKKESTPAN